ncbi:hypothetical protein GCM10022221_66460 [Actinocorallia aurea]
MVGGLLTEHLSWRWTLYVNLIFAALALAGGLLLLQRAGRAAKPTLDLQGTLLVSAGLFCLVYGFSNADSHGWDDVLTWGFLTGGVLLIAVFAFWQTRAANPLLPLRVLRHRDRAASYWRSSSSPAACSASSCSSRTTSRSRSATARSAPASRSCR